MNKENFMNEAIKEAYDGINNGHGGPFGSVIVKDGKIVGRGHNRVVLKNDPTAHGEVEAIRNACANLGTFDLTGCELYTTAAECPMCKCAVMWANISKVYTGCNVHDSDKIGFRDVVFETAEVDHEEVSRDKCLELFAHYDNMNHTMY